MKTHLDLFSGIGGFALAAGWAGYRTVGFCEVEDYPRRILSKRFSGVPIHGDIRELDGAAYRGVTLITGGYPCQPRRTPGKRKKFEVFVKNDSGRVVRVAFGDPKMSIKKDQPARKKSYCARSGGIKGKTDRTSANYWSRKMWDC